MKSRRTVNPKQLLYILCLGILAGCSNIKYLAEDELLYVGGEVTAKNDISKSKKKQLESNMENLLRPEPNSGFLGLRPQLYFYNIAGGEDADSGLGKWIKENLGEPPVLFRQVDLDRNAEIVEGYAVNKGFFNARASADSTVNNKKVTALYNVDLGNQYTFNEVKYPADTTELTASIAEAKKTSLLKPGEPFDLDVIKGERQRIDDYLKEKGYYFFNPDYLLFQADSTLSDHRINMNLRVKPETPPKARQTYKINNVYVYADFSISGDTIPTDSPVAKNYEGITIIDPENRFKPQVFKRSLLFEKGDTYSRSDHNKSLNRLINLGIFKFVKNQFQVSDTVENSMDAYYYLTPQPKKSLRAELLGKSNSADFVGTELDVSWRNRNAFGGTELLTITARGAYEVQVGGRGQGFNVFRFGGESSLTWPRFITPFNIKSTSGYIPRTKASLRYERQVRQRLYSLNSFSSSFGYLWKENVRKEHELTVMDINYVNPSNVTDLYRARAELNPNLLRIIEEQLIFGPSYTYRFTNTMETQRKNTFYYQGAVDLSGNIAGLITGADRDEGGPEEILGVPFSQFVKLENDFRYYRKLGSKSEWANRIIVGTGIPYGNSREIPFIRQFFVGGTNSIRAFRARTLGPGSYDAELEEASFIPDQSGDLKLELNTEYRRNLFSVVEGALFVDAGNVWLLNENPDKPGGKLSGDFLKELAVGTGFGLRFDLSFLVLRTDLAFPVRKPFLPEGERWVIDQIDFGSGDWRRENLVLSIAIGYPF